VLTLTASSALLPWFRFKNIYAMLILPLVYPAFLYFIGTFCLKTFSRASSLEKHYVTTGHDGGHASILSSEADGKTADDVSYTRRIFNCEVPGCEKSFVTVPSDL
jgi:hypothetical protein